MFVLFFRFARKPQQGLCFLQTKGFVGTEPADIARFFHVEERLDKSVIGDFLGDGTEYYFILIIF